MLFLPVPEDPACLQLSTQLGEKADTGGRDKLPGKQIGNNMANDITKPSDGATSGTEAIRQTRTTADLLNWADDIAGLEENLAGHTLASSDLDDPEMLDALATTISYTDDQQMTSSQAAAKALLKAAQQTQNKRRGSTTASRYMNSELHQGS